jgi:hypothetical protein
MYVYWYYSSYFLGGETGWRHLIVIKQTKNLKYYSSYFLGGETGWRHLIVIKQTKNLKYYSSYFLGGETGWRNLISQQTNKNIFINSFSTINVHSMPLTHLPLTH